MEKRLEMIDVIQSKWIEVHIDDCFIWVNVDGLCRFRASMIRCKEFILADRRTPQTSEN